MYIIVAPIQIKEGFKEQYIKGCLRMPEEQFATSRAA